MIKITSNDKYVGKLLCFLIFPFFTFIYNLKSLHLKSSRFIFFLWGVLFAWSMHYTNFSRGIDFLGVISEFYAVSQLSFEDILNSYETMFSDDGNIRTYELFMFWLARLFSNNYHFLFFLASIPFMYCMVKSIAELLKGFRVMSLPLFLALILFIMPKDFFSIQNFRFSTATWLVVYATIQYYYNNRKNYLFIILASILVHTSFIFYNLIFFSFYLFRDVKISFWLKCYYFSIPFAFLSADLFSGLNFSFLPDVFQRWIDAYLSEESFKTYGNLSYLNGSGFYFINAAFVIFRSIVYICLPLQMIKYSKKYSLNIDNNYFFRYFLVLFIITNLVQCIPSLGVRYLGLVRMFSIFCWVRFIPSTSNSSKYLYVLFSSCFYELIVETLAHDLMVQDFDFFIGNTFYLIYKFIGVNSLV